MTAICRFIRRGYGLSLIHIFNQNFVKRCVEPRQNIIKDIGSCFSYLFVDAKKADILYYAQQEEVALICYDDPDYQFAPA